MHEDEDSIFNVIHSLPVLSCSVALAQRTPAAGYGQQTKYMPDYGGYLETASSCLKNNALASGFAFDIHPKKFSIRLSNPDNRSTSIFPNDCLTVTSYLQSDNRNDLSVIRQLGSIVTFDLLTQVSEDEPYVTVRYDCIASKDRNPRGLKQVKNSHDDYLLIKFAKSVKIYNLNRAFNYAVTQEETNSSTDDQTAHKRVASIKDRTGYAIRDASLSHMNKSYLGIASDNANIHSIKLYDLSSSRREPLQNIEWATVENEFPSIDTCLLSKELRGRVIRTFIPMRPTNWGTQQLDHIPSHLCNLLVTNEHKISLVDPRSDSLVLNLLSKAELPSFYPVEYLRKTVFSNKNDHQFYSMTNVHLRVLDTRYPGVPLGQIGHMLESESYNSMDMKLISFPDSDMESLCCSSMSRLCFMTFDQAQIGNLINPKSTHLPYHDSSLNDRSIEGDLPAFGLSAIVPADTRKTNFDAFSIFQLSLQGDLLLRSYTRTGTSHFGRFSPRMGLISENEQAFPTENPVSLVPIREAHEIPDRVIMENQNPPSPEDRIDLLDSSFLEEIENRLESKRAQEKYELMKKKLCGI